MLKVYQLRRNQNTFEVTLNYKGVGVRVSFVDGNTYNGTPAKCYTNDPFRQRAIEASKLFKDGDIVLERSVAEASDNKKPVVVQRKPVVRSQQVAKPAPKPADETPEPPKTEGPSDDGKNKKEFTNLGEAIIFIATNYNKQVTTANEARKFLKEQGIQAVIKNG